MVVLDYLKCVQQEKTAKFMPMGVESFGTIVVNLATTTRCRRAL